MTYFREAAFRAGVPLRWFSVAIKRSACVSALIKRQTLPWIESQNMKCDAVPPVAITAGLLLYFHHFWGNIFYLKIVVSRKILVAMVFIRLRGYLIAQIVVFQS